MSVYAPDPKFYQKQINQQQDILEKFQEASYDSKKRGYVVDGTIYTEAQRKSQISAINTKIKQLKADEKKFGKYGPGFGKAAKPNEAGRQFMELLEKARNIEVTDFDTALANLEAWKQVNDFAAANPDMVVVQRVDTTEGPMMARIDPFANPQIKNALERGFPAAQQLAQQQAEVGTTQIKTIVKGNNAAATESRQKIVTNQEELTRRLELVDSVVAKPSSASAVVGEVTTTPTATTQTRATTQPGTVDTMAGLRRRGQVAGGFGATKPRKQEEPGTPTNTGGGGVVTSPSGRRTRQPRLVNWEPKFREMFPQQAWMLDLDRTKYGDVFKLFQKAVGPDKLYETPEGQARFLALLDNTSFIKELAQTGKAREIRNLVGDLGFDSVPFNKFLTTAMNFGWEGDTLKQEVYKEAFRKDTATGEYVNPTAIKRVRSSNDYLSVKNIGRAFFSEIDDKTVEQRLTGMLTDDDLARQQRELAKGKYAHLSNLIDQGLTLESIAESYRERAARLLEKDVNDIDMGSSDFSQAFNYGEEGKKRMMSDGEWEILLRSDQRFGWRKTQNAKDEARNLSASIAQAFGRVL